MMRHPEHGITVAAGAEIEWNKQHGWKIEEPKPVVPVIEGTITKAKIGRPKKVK